MYYYFKVLRIARYRRERCGPLVWLTLNEVSFSSVCGNWERTNEGGDGFHAPILLTLSSVSLSLSLSHGNEQKTVTQLGGRIQSPSSVKAGNGGRQRDEDLFRFLKHSSRFSFSFFKVPFPPRSGFSSCHEIHVSARHDQLFPLLCCCQVTDCSIFSSARTYNTRRVGSLTSENLVEVTVTLFPAGGTRLSLSLSCVTPLVPVPLFFRPLYILLKKNNILLLFIASGAKREASLRSLSRLNIRPGRDPLSIVLLSFI